MSVITPNGHEEITVREGCFTIRKRENFKECQNGEWMAVSYARSITFNDTFISWADKEGKLHIQYLNGQYLNVFPKNFTPIEEEQSLDQDEKQISIFDLLGGN